MLVYKEKNQKVNQKKPVRTKKWIEKSCKIELSKVAK